MYKIIGGDQKEYGPISAEQIRQWIAEGRLNAHTKAQPEGGAEWKELSALPEFADAFGAPAQPGQTPAPFPTSAGAGLGAGGGGGREAALEAVKAPAIALMVVAGLGIAYYAFNALVALVGGGMMFHRSLPPDFPPQLRAFVEGARGPLGSLISLLIVALNAFVLFGALKLKQLQAYGMAVAACIVAMLPCQCCCLFGLPIGIWALVVLMRPEVKSQFR